MTSPATYKWIVRFTRRFLRGNLKGLEHSDSLRFVSFADAQKWLDGMRETPYSYEILPGATISQIQ